MAVDLFGNDHGPPRKGAAGYLEHLAELPYPDGLTFWSLGHGDYPAGQFGEFVWLTSMGGFELHRVDIRTGELIDRDRVPP
jgi:hypothetical protein